MSGKHTTPDPVDVAVGARVRLRRRQLDQSQTDLANACGVTFQQVQKYEKGSNRISASMLVRVAAFLQTTGGALLGEDGTAAIEPPIMAQLATPGAVELLRAYAVIDDNAVRHAILAVAEAASAPDPLPVAVRRPAEPAHA